MTEGSDSFVTISGFLIQGCGAEEYLNYYAARKPLSPELIEKKALFENKVFLKVMWTVSQSEATTYYRPGKGKSEDDSVYLSKAEFIRRATAIYGILSKYDLPYRDVAIFSGLAGREKDHVSQRIIFSKGDSLDKMLASYATYKQ
ncbi:MAG: hypothetical protein FWC54_03195 [Actinomycetia bacterium]|nr:hypothetical protein [Actinomycetes bacterium]